MAAEVRGPMITPAVEKTGYMSKLGGAHDGKTGNWKRRFFVLTNVLAYYTDEQAYEQGRAPKGVVKLDTYFVTALEGANPNLEFTVHALPRSLTCRAETVEDLRSWMVKLLEPIDKHHSASSHHSGGTAAAAAAADAAQASHDAGATQAPVVTDAGDTDEEDN